ncbi:MAG: terminase family protein [Syntrophales bacterium]|nr:terminase family protein [Syntrophales bacterium]
MLSFDLKAALDWEVHKADPVRWVEDCGLLRDKAGNACQLDENQRAILNPANKRVILNCHRQWGKSTISSLLCFWRALFYERSLCLLVAPSLRQSSENFRKISDALETISPKPELDEENKLTLKFSNGSRIISLPGSQKTVRGFTAPDLIIIDEDAQADDELFGALLPMLTNSPDGRLILASTPWGCRGHFYKIWQEGGPEWLKIRVIAEENPRVRPEVLEEARKSPNGALWFRQEYCGEFVSDEFSLFDEARLKRAVSNDFEEVDAEDY